jgi:hypothetical protein
MNLLTKTTSNFNERRFLIRSLVAIFIVQFASTGAQFATCFKLSNSLADLEKTNLVCAQANSSFAETGKLALTTLLALLVPAAPSVAADVEQVTRRRKTTNESESP